MDSVQQFVMCSYPKFQMEKQNSPSYVCMYTKNNDEIVLVYARNKLSYNALDNKEKNNKCVEEELELTGSPLKLDLSLHTVLDDTMITDEPQLWTKEEGTHNPIAVEKAREIANLYNKGLTSTPGPPMWILINPSAPGKPLLLTVQSDDAHFTRGIVNYEGSMMWDDVDLDELVLGYAKQEGIGEDMITTRVDCKYLLSGISYGSNHNVDELLSAPHTGITELACDWSARTLQTPYITCKVVLEQEVIVGHLASPCHAIWKSVSSLHNINQLLVDMTAAGHAAVNLNTAYIRTTTQGSKPVNNTKRLNELLNETEAYTYTPETLARGCLCITDDTTTLRQCLTAMCAHGSSNDFTYKLWDILRDCETAEELITLLIHALKFISSGRTRPFIDVNNKTYLSKLVMKLSRGHSQTAKVLMNLRASPPQALSLVAQVGAEKTMWEYTRVMSLLEYSFYINGIWNTDVRSHESIEQINQTIQDMTMSGGDFTLNPFESLAAATENSIRLDCESFYDDDPNELTVDDFASLKKHGLVAEKRDVNEVPIIADEIDISPWKNLLMKFAQVHVCLEHLYRAETSLRADFGSLQPIASRLLEHYVSDKSPVRTVGQLMSDPVQAVAMPIANNVVHDHLKKPAFWYRAELSRKDNADGGMKRDLKLMYVFSQQPVFPPPVWQHLEPQTEEIAEVTAMGEEELKYHCTKYTFISNKIRSKLTI